MGTTTRHMQFSEPAATDGAKTTQFDSNFDKIERGRQMQAVASVVVVQYQIVYLNTAGQWALYTGNVTSEAADMLFIVQTGANSGAVAYAQFDGIVTNTAWTWTPFAPLWGTAASVLSATPVNAYSAPIGFAISATEVLLTPYVRANKGLHTRGNTATSANPGSATALPSAPVFYLQVTILGQTYKIPVYNG